MRLLFVRTDAAAQPTDPAEGAGPIAEGLARRGHTVHAVVARRDLDRPHVAVRRGVLVHGLPLRGADGGPALAPGLLPTLGRLLEGTDVLVLPVPLLQVLPATALARRRGVATVLAQDGDLRPADGAAGRALAAAQAAMTMVAGRLAAAVVAPSRERAADSPLLRPLWDRIHFVAAPAGPGPDDLAGALDDYEALLRGARDGTL